MTIKAPHGKVVLTAIIDSEKKAEELKARSGLLMGKPEHEPIPNRGVVYSIGGGIEAPEYSVGDEVILNLAGNEGWAHDGQRYFTVEPDQIVAKVAA